MDEDVKARPHHYNFAYRALPEIAIAGAVKLDQMLASAMGNRFLQALWQKVGESVPVRERLPTQGLTCTVRKLVDGGKGIVVSLPPPERIPEAWFVAYALDPSGRTFRCFSLEKTIDFETGSLDATVVGEWIGYPNPRHRNLGRGPAPSIDQFVAAINEIIQPR